MLVKEKIGVFVAAGSKTPEDKSLLEQGRLIGEYLGKNGYTFIQGASKKGLMGATYNEFVKYSKDVILHLWAIFDEHEKYVGTQKIHKSLNFRLEGFLSDTKVLIVLPGANGTLHEFCTFFEYARYFSKKYKIILVNYKGFYNHLIKLIDRQIKDGFYMEDIFKKTVVIVKDAQEAIENLPKIKR